MRPPRPGEGPASCGDRRRRLAPPQTTVRGRDGAAVVELDPVGVDRGDPRPSRTSAPASVSFFSAYSWALLGELPQQGVAAVDQRYLARHCQLSRLMKRQHRARPTPRWSRPRSVRPLRRRHRSSRARRTPDRRSRPKEFLQMQPQAFGVSHRVQRKGVLCGAGHSEEVRPCTRRHHQVRPVQRPAVVERESCVRTGPRR